MKKKLRKGDQVIVIAGNDRGKMGKVVLFKEDTVIVEGINLRKKHLKKSQEHQKGQIIDIERPIHISNVKICVEDKPVKLRTRVGNSQVGERELYYLDANQKPVVYRTLKKGK